MSTPAPETATHTRTMPESTMPASTVPVSTMPVSTMQVSMVSVTPVKGLGLHHPDHIDVRADGVVGDRALFLVTDTGDDGGELISCTELGDLMAHRAEYDPATGVLALHGPDGLVREDVVRRGTPIATDFYGLRTVPGHEALGWADTVSAIAGRRVRLVVGHTGGYDVDPLTLLGRASTDALAAASGADPVDDRRFRMNVTLVGTAPHDEDTWQGRTLRLGEVTVRVGGPVKRCAATTRNPDTGAIDLQTLRMIGAARGRIVTPEYGPGFYFGVYAQVLSPGRIHVGDEVTLTD